MDQLFLLQFMWRHAILAEQQEELMLTPSNNILCLLAFVWHLSSISMTFRVGVPHSGCSNTLGKQNLILNIWEPIRFTGKEISASSQENLSLGFATRYDSNWSAQLKKLARVMKLRNYEI